jgi:hypothetical protein
MVNVRIQAKEFSASCTLLEPGFALDQGGKFIVCDGKEARGVNTGPEVACRAFLHTTFSFQAARCEYSGGAIYQAFGYALGKQYADVL